MGSEYILFLPESIGGVDPGQVTAMVELQAIMKNVVYDIAPEAEKGSRVFRVVLGI